jgi:hypothetical protein
MLYNIIVKHLILKNMKIFLGLLAIALGIVIVIKKDWFVQNFGSIAWAEEHLGTSGGSRLMWQLIGIAMILISLMVMTGMMQAIALSILAPLFRGVS